MTDGKRPDPCLNCQLMRGLLGELDGLKVFCQKVCHIMDDYVSLAYNFAPDTPETDKILWRAVGAE